MTRFYTIEEKKPHPDKLFLFIRNGKLYFGTRIRHPDLKNCFYYRLYFNSKKHAYYSEEEILHADEIGQRIIDGWFYYPSTKNIYDDLDVPIRSEVSDDQSPVDSDGATIIPSACTPHRMPV